MSSIATFPRSGFHLALHVSYPNAADLAHARVAHRNAGGDIMIHGVPRGTPPLGPLQHMVDWTSGCVALTNREIDEVYKLVPNGTPIDIVR